MKSKSSSVTPQSDLPSTMLTPRNPEDLRWEAQQVQLAIAGRAHELFELRSREHGHDWEDWFRAESELLRPVSVASSESEYFVSVCANVFDFGAKELGVSIEPHRITILGKKVTSKTKFEGNRVEYIDWSRDQIYKVIDLSPEVMPESSVVELQAGLLRFELPKAAKSKIEAAAPAA